VLVATSVLVLASPLFLVICLAVKLTSRGPAFYSCERIGRNGRPFRCLKFRTMVADADESLHRILRASSALTEEFERHFKLCRDPRVTRVGRVLRRISLDELPQFWNVLKGEMSVVGPRPPIPAEVKQYKRWQRRRLSVKPGITCTWQVSGRNNVDFDRWMELDLEYIDNWSLWGDVRICLQTIPAVIAARGAQ
jgi:lipopolysaccharide/colanic/teichoic acid biosynthesis glycosyltransferase